MRIFIIAFLLLSVSCFGQTSDKRGTIKVKKVQSVAIDTISDFYSDQEVIKLPYRILQAPTFPGGDIEMKKFISKNVKYPKRAKDAGISGTVYVAFFVETDGSITNVKVLRGVSGGPDCDKEALRVVKIMPNWLPKKEDGKPVRIQVSLPIIFNLK